MTLPTQLDVQYPKLNSDGGDETLSRVVKDGLTFTRKREKVVVGNLVIDFMLVYIIESKSLISKELGCKESPTTG